MSSYQHIRDFIAGQLRRRASLNQAIFRPSDVWNDRVLLLRYVRTLPDEELDRIRFHTYYMTSDSVIPYMYEPDMKPNLLGLYEALAARLDFRPSEGENSYGFETGQGEIVTIDLVRYMLVLHDVAAAGIVDRNRAGRILEIGCGFGGLARMALAYNPNVSYVLCDLEELLFFQAVYLTQSIGRDSVHLLDGSEDPRTCQEPGHAYLLPQHRSEVLYRWSFDVTISQQTMQEMTTDQVTNYCDLIAKSSKYLYSCNRDGHPLALLPGSKAENTPLVRGLNPYLAGRFEIVASNAPKGADLVPAENRPTGFFVGDQIVNRTIYKMPES